ncbi:MAG TPA: hypothetical protein VK541_01170 [Pedobacter sp.]|uniref:hypothetical protein n=1 Tax=Pedobacter sp. TaxID=1411316 RepID=UPI002C5083A1|nr:hypothetical protein [Pedobacter sp.]HMI01057.1 hypothetical protein [Pedobacter sp.]
MKVSLIMIIVVGLSFNTCIAQQDSSLVKFIKGIHSVIDKRANDLEIQTKSKTAFVILRDSIVKVDSLYKYNFKDFSDVTIRFDMSEHIYGHTAQFGVIVLNEKKRKKE